MKKVITASLFLIAFLSYSTAQGNLQFNQVVVGDIVAINLPYASTVIGTITVPAGKVWKIESTSYTYYQAPNTWMNAGSGYYVRIGNFEAYVQHTGIAQHYLPLWLPEGTYDVTAIGNNNDNTFSYSAIEFNVIP